MTARNICFGVFAVLCTILPLHEAVAEDKNWRISTSANYETGEYGTSTRTDTFYMPVTVKRYLNEGDLSVIIPYIIQTGGSEVITIDGTVFQVTTAPGPDVTNSGLGDLVLRGSYYLFSESREVPFDLNLTAKIKVPTADESKGFGTGEFDTGVGLEFAKTLSSGFTGYLDIYYTAIGDPPGVDFEDRVFFDVGFSRMLSPGWALSAFYEESTQLLKSKTNLRDFLVCFEFKADSRTKIFFSATLGLTETSPDYGLSAGASFLF